MKKPTIFAKLKKGRIIDTITGFVDTFNWISAIFEFINKTGGKKNCPISIETEGDGVKITLYYR